MALLRTRCCPLLARPLQVIATSTSSGRSATSSNHQSFNTTPSSSLPSSAAPSPIVSPLDSQSSSGVSCSTPVSNPRVRAGLILPELADIWNTPPVTKEPTKRIVGARDLTANEYYEWLKGEEQKKKKKRRNAVRSEGERRKRKKKS